MDKTEKLDLITRFGSAVDPLINLVKGISSVVAIDFRPSLPAAWTIREHAVHFLDAETYAHGRLRLCVAEPGTELFVWNEEAWQAKTRYETADALASLETARALRKVTAAMAMALVDDNWDAYHVHHPQRGRLTLADILKLYTDHAKAHLGYFHRNLEAFESAKTGRWSL
jgi:hypothetical protein